MDRAVEFKHNFLQISQDLSNVTLVPEDEGINQNKTISKGSNGILHKIEIKDKSEQLDMGYELDMVQSKATCPICKESFISVKRMQCHKSIAHEQEDNTANPHKCDLCGKSFLKSKWYDKHMRKNHSIISTSEFKCEDCQKYYIDKGSLNQHMRTQHAKAMTLTCEVCQENFENTSKTMLKRNFSKHMTSKHPSVPFHKCEVCNKCFFNKGTFNNHRTSHKQYNICDMCGKCFTFLTDLAKHHLRIHGTEEEKNTAKKYECTLCKLRFYKNSNLRYHKETHSTTYDFQCKKCDFRSKSSNTMRLHDGKIHLKIWGIITQEHRDMRNAKKRLARHSKKADNGGLYRAGEERRLFNNYMREFQQKERTSCELCCKQTTNMVWHKKYMCTELKK